MINIISNATKLSSLPPAPDRFAAEKEDSDRDSEEEDDAVQLLLDDKSGYPILPPQSNMSLDKCKSAIRLYWTLTYRTSINLPINPNY
jgi:hypothetical protein